MESPQMVRIVILGIAQDGGIPHFTCNCKNCLHFSESKNFRFVSSIGILGKTKSLMIDATPDLPKQFNLFREHLEKDNYKLNGLLVTHMHIGHYTGLIYFGRESASTNKFPLYTTKENFEFLKTNKPFSYLFEREQLQENTISPEEEWFLDDSVSIIPFLVPHRNEDGNTIGIEIINKETNKKAIYITDVDYLTDELQKRIDKADKVILDGTFFTKTELMIFRKVPHPPITDTMNIFGKQPENRFYFTHLNHSNPALEESSKEYQEIKNLGYNLCYEGQVIEF